MFWGDFGGSGGSLGCRATSALSSHLLQLSIVSSPPQELPV